MSQRRKARAQPSARPGTSSGGGGGVRIYKRKRKPSAASVAMWQKDRAMPVIGHAPPVRTLADMTPDEVRAIEERYGMPVRPR